MYNYFLCYWVYVKVLVFAAFSGESSLMTWNWYVLLPYLAAGGQTIGSQDMKDLWLDMEYQTELEYSKLVVKAFGFMSALQLSFDTLYICTICNNLKVCSQLLLNFAYSFGRHSEHISERKACISASLSILLTMSEWLCVLYCCYC